MDLIYRSDKYKSYQSKLESAKRQFDQMPDLLTIQNEINQILDDLRQHQHADETRQLMWLLLIPVLIVSIASIVMHGWLWRIIPIVALIVWAVASRLRIVAATKASATLKPGTKSDFANDHYWLQAKIAYMMSGIDVKETRIRSLRWLYALFCPVLIYVLIELIKGPYDGEMRWTALLLAFVIGGVFWYFYFRSDLLELRAVRALLSEYQSRLMAFAAPDTE